VLFPAAPWPHRLSYPARDGVVVPSPQEAVQSRVVRYAPQWQDLAQLAVLAETHLGFAKSPVRLAHQAENGQQLRLGEWVFAETTALGRQNTPGYIAGHAGKGQESDFWHPTSCSIRKHSLPRFVDLPKIYLCRGCQQSHFKPFRIRSYEKTGEGGTPAHFHCARNLAATSKRYRCAFPFGNAPRKWRPDSCQNAWKVK